MGTALTELVEPETDIAVGPGWVGLVQHDATRFSFELSPGLARFDRQMFGGAGIAVALAAFEAATGRSALWATAQFVSIAHLGQTIDVEVDVLAHGHQTSQNRLTATVDGRTIFAALGATGTARPDRFDADFGTMPVVPPPDECVPWRFIHDLPDDFVPLGPLLAAEYRQTDPDDNSNLLWARMRDDAQSAESLAYLADFVPGLIVHSMGRRGGGSSLDNAVRLGAPPDCDWVLIDVDPYFGHGGYVHGAARLWTPDGRVVALASQTATARYFD